MPDVAPTVQNVSGSLPRIAEVSSLTDNEINLNLKNVLDAYVWQAAVIEKLLIEFNGMRQYIELFMLEMVRRGKTSDDIAKQLETIDDQHKETVAAVQNKSKGTFFKETKHIGNL